MGSKLLRTYGDASTFVERRHKACTCVYRHSFARLRPEWTPPRYVRCRDAPSLRPVSHYFSLVSEAQSLFVLQTFMRGSAKYDVFPCAPCVSAIKALQKNYLKRRLLNLDDVYRISLRKFGVLKQYTYIRTISRKLRAPFFSISLRVQTDGRRLRRKNEPVPYI